MNFKRLAAAFLLLASSLSIAQTEENSLTIPTQDWGAFLQRWGQSVGILAHPTFGGPLGDAYPGDDFILYLPQAQVRWGGAVFNARNVVLGLPPAAVKSDVKLGDPSVGLADGIVLFVDQALLHLPGFYLDTRAGSSTVQLRSSLSTQNVKFIRFEMAP